MIEQTFFELIQVAIGTRICLSHTPSADEWGELYAMAKKQSLVGVCFAGVQKLQTQRQEPPEMLYLTWLGMAAKIQQRNEVVNRQCVDLQKRLSADGFQSCILKGQGVAASYGSLSLLRQSGDIDLWVEGNIHATVNRFDKMGIKLSNINIKHADARFFDDTEVEIHFRPSWFYNPFANKRLQKWFKEQSSVQMQNKVGDMIAPDARFNAVYILLHIYRHLLDEGVGLRQLMDYYFVLCTGFKEFQVSEVQAVLKNLGLLKFAGSVMWVLRESFALEQEKLICKPNERLGRLLFAEIMNGGNFGHYDSKLVHYENVWINGFHNLQKNLCFLPLYRFEVLCSPIWKVWHWGWRKKNKY